MPRREGGIETVCMVCIETVRRLHAHGPDPIDASYIELSAKIGVFTYLPGWQTP